MSGCTVRRLKWLASGAVLAAAVAAPVIPTLANTASDWRSYGRDEGHARHSPLTEITPANVSQLKPAWTYNMRPAGTVGENIPIPDGVPARFRTGFSASEATPVVVDGVMYLATPYRRVVALDAASGRELWAYNLPGNDQPSTRGVAYWQIIGDRKSVV